MKKTLDTWLESEEHTHEIVLAFRDRYYRCVCG